MGLIQAGSLFLISLCDHEHIKACRVFHLFGALTAGLAGGGIEFMRKPESQRDAVSFIGHLILDPWVPPEHLEVGIGHAAAGGDRMDSGSLACLGSVALR